jgi:hypothetical protein
VQLAQPWGRDRAIRHAPRNGFSTCSWRFRQASIAGGLYDRGRQWADRAVWQCVPARNDKRLVRFIERWNDRRQMGRRLPGIRRPVAHTMRLVRRPSPSISTATVSPRCRN